MRANHRDHTIAVIAFDGISPFHLSVPCLVFGDDRSDAGVPRFKVLVCAFERSPLRTTAGFTIDAPCNLDALKKAGTIIVPGWRNIQEGPPEALLKSLRSAHKRGARIIGLCQGAFVLAEAGLLDGRPATTHWYSVSRFAERYPQVQLQPDALYVDDGDILTSAGTAAGLDCCLHVLRSYCGAEVANRAARRMVVAPHRHGGQAQFIQQPISKSARGDRLADLLAWAAANLKKPHSLDTLAARIAMSRRTFTRRFREATGTTVGKWLQNQRLSLAQRLLETTDHSVDIIAGEAGFGSAVSLRQHFAAAFNTSPSAYRRQFRGT